jgi:hypothetical protein
MRIAHALPRFVCDLLASPPQRGGGLNLWLYRVARVLHPYRTADEIVLLLSAATAGEPVKPAEIERAVKNSATTAWKPGQPAPQIHNAPTWPPVNAARRAAIILASGGGLYDLWENSPYRIEDNESHCEAIIDRLFAADALLCCGTSNSDFDTRPRDEWRGTLSQLSLIVPSPMTALTGTTQDGKESAHSLDNTGSRRFLVIEQDNGDADEQSAILLHLAKSAPLALAVHSGSKSIHGWFYCAGQPEERLQRFMRYAVSLGADHATWTRSQFVRMPGGTRDNGKPQMIYFFHPEAIK